MEEELMWPHSTLRTYWQLMVAERKGDIFFSSVATGKMPRIQSITPYLHPCKQPQLNSVDHQNPKEQQIKTGTIWEEERDQQEREEDKKG